MFEWKVFRMNRIKIKTLHFHPNQHRTKRPTGFIRPTATTRYSSPTTQKRETAWDKNRIIQTIKKQKTWIKSKLSALFSVCGRWDLNPHEHTPTRSLVLPVCQFQHSRLLFFNFLCPMIFSPTKSSIAQFHLNCKPVFRKFIPEFIESEYSKNPARLCTGLSVMQKKGLEPSWCCHHTDLNRARLPIPPLLRNF